MGKGGEDIKFLKIQTCVLKVNLCCHGCQKKVKKVLSKIDGVYTTSIDVEGRKVIVTGDVDPAILIKKLGKAGKHAELCPAKSAAKDQNFLDQLQKFQLDHSKESHKGNEKSQKGFGAGGGKDAKVHQPLQAKGLMDLNFPSLKDLKVPVLNKESKAGKADHHLMEEETDEGSDFDDDELDEFEDDDEEFDYMDESDAESYDSLPKVVKPVNFQPSGHGEATDKKGGGKGEEAKLKNKSEGGKKTGGGKKDEGKNGQGVHDSKSGGGNNNNNNNNNNKGGNHAHHNANPPNKGGGGGGLAMGQPHMSQLSSMQGLPPLEGIPGGGGYFHGGGGAVPPEMMSAAANPYQQQYLQALQQQRMMMMMNNQAMGYGYGHVQPAYMMPQPHSYTAFSEENPNSCSIM